MTLPETTHAPDRPAPEESRRGLSRRQALIGGGLLAGGALVGGGIWAAQSPSIDFASSNLGASGPLVGVLYDSQFGSTGGLAVAIAEQLSVSARVQVRHVSQVAALTDFDAIVFGAPVQRAVMKASATDWLQANKSALSAVPHALFMPSASFGIDPDRQRQIAEKTAVLEQAAAAGGCNPVALLPTGGKVDFSAMSPFSSVVYQVMSGSSQQGDFRDLDAVRTWAAATAPLLGLDA